MRWEKLIAMARGFCLEELSLSEWEAAMKRWVLMLMLMCPVALMGQPAATGGFPLTVHVTGSKWVTMPIGLSPRRPVMQINVLIAGRRFELDAAPDRNEGLLMIGDYKARLIEEEHHTPYEMNQTYLLQFPDGKTQKFYLEGISE